LKRGEKFFNGIHGNAAILSALAIDSFTSRIAIGIQDSHPNTRSTKKLPE
jgi:hypothetical protein